MKSNNIYVIHGYTSSSQSEWFPWLKEQFENRQVKIDIPNMPDSENPHLETWLSHLRKNVLNIDENTMDEQTEGLQEFVDEPLEIARIKSLIPSRVVITATDDDIVPTEATQKLAEALDANLIILSSGKHFIARDGYTDFPVLLNEIQKLINT